MKLEEFRLESYFAQWEFSARHLLCASDAQTMTMSALLELASDEDRLAWDALALGYTQTQGGPELRRAIAIKSAGRAVRVISYSSLSTENFRYAENS